MIILTKEQIILLHEEQINNYGGIHGIRDNAMLDSALNTPFQTFGNEELYPTIIDKAARLCYGLVNNHPFIDGNKRIGSMAMLIFLYLNKKPVNCTEDELIEVILKIANSQITDKDLSKWLLDHTD